MYFETKDLAVGYNGRPLIEHIDIGIRKGGILCLIGPNGSGKSTLIKLLCGLYQTDSGQIFIDGWNIADLAPEALELLERLSRQAEQEREEETG